RTRDLAGQIRAIALHARLFVVAHVVPGPAVEGAFLHAGCIVGHEVIAALVALVHRAPHIAGGRLDGHADAVAQAGGEGLADRVVAAHVIHTHHRAVFFQAPWRTQAVLPVPGLHFGGALLGDAVGEDVALRTHGEIHLAAIARECDVAREVAATDRRDLRDHHFGHIAGLGVADLVGVTHHAVHFGDIDPLRLFGRGIEGDAIGLPQSLREHGRGCGAAI